MWALASALFAAWFAATFIFQKGGLVHVVLFNAVAVALIQFVHERRARRQ